MRDDDQRVSIESFPTQPDESFFIYGCYFDRDYQSFFFLFARF